MSNGIMTDVGWCWIVTNGDGDKRRMGTMMEGNDDERQMGTTMEGDRRQL